MPRGPVPSTIKNFIDEKWDWVDRPEGFDEAITISTGSFGEVNARAKKAQYIRPIRNGYGVFKGVYCLLRQ